MDVKFSCRIYIFFIFKQIFDYGTECKNTSYYITKKIVVAKEDVSVQMIYSFVIEKFDLQNNDFFLQYLDKEVEEWIDLDDDYWVHYRFQCYKIESIEEK